MRPIFEYLLGKNRRTGSNKHIAAEAIYEEVQSDVNEKAAYHTLDMSESIDKYKMGFMTWNEDIKCAVLMAFNTPKDMCKLLGCDEDEWDDIGSMEPGGHYNRNGEEILRIW